jgi:predicted GIY-YIG superfamily endonuclease
MNRTAALEKKLWLSSALKLQEMEQAGLGSQGGSSQKSGSSQNSGSSQKSGGGSQADNDGEGEWIYVLKLEDGCIYVGKTTNPSARLGQHRNGGGYKGSAWTRLHPPTASDYKMCRPVKKEYSGLEEDKMTKIWMMKRGIDKVRGGSYSQCVLPAQQLASLKRELWHNKCMIYTRGCTVKCQSTTIIKRVLHMNI